ncbi:MAG TPA: hypothetical protein VG986_00535 [Pseudolabrys sp.]|nr:hypothetical protein [Pseudolabrys sp.]
MTIVKLLAAVPPKLTADAVVKPLPVMVTLLPPAELPPEGVTELTVGAVAGPEVQEKV